jgi:hypothetical protein
MKIYSWIISMKLKILVEYWTGFLLFQEFQKKLMLISILLYNKIVILRSHLKSHF